MDCIVYGVPKGPDTTERLSLHRNVFIWDFLNGSAGKESACNAEDLAAIPGLGRSSGEGNGYPLQYSGLENSTNSIVHGVSKSRTWLSDFHFTSLDKCKATLGTAIWQRQLVACQESPFLFFLKHNLDFLIGYSITWSKVSVSQTSSQPRVRVMWGEVTILPGAPRKSHEEDRLSMLAPSCWL